MTHFFGMRPSFESFSQWFESFHDFFLFSANSNILVKQIVQDYIYTWVLSWHDLFLQINLSVTAMTYHIK